MNDLAEGGYFDEDVHGFRRIVAHGDEWMHSRLVHEGVEQRVRVEVCMWALRNVSVKYRWSDNMMKMSPT